MGVKERKEREKAELREKIITAAEELFAEDGYQNVSMRKIAHKIEYSLPVIYHCFENKADILSELYNRRNGLLYERMEQAYQKEYECPQEKIQAMAEVYFRFARENPEYYELAFSRNALRQEQNLVYLDRSSKGFLVYRLLFLAVEECEGEKSFPPYDAATVCQMLWSGVHGLISLELAHNEFEWKDPELLLRATVSQLIGK